MVAREMDLQTLSGRYDTGRHTLYVNDGTGYVAYPMRLGAWPEVTLFTLKRCR